MIRLHNLFGNKRLSTKLGSEVAEPPPASGAELRPNVAEEVPNPGAESKRASTRAAVEPTPEPDAVPQSDAVGIAASARTPSGPQAKDLRKGEYYEVKFIEVLTNLLTISRTSLDSSQTEDWFKQILQAVRKIVRKLRLTSWIMSLFGLGWLAAAALEQDPVARLVVLSRKLSETEPPYGYYREAYFAALLILQQTDDVTVQTVLDDLEYATSRNSPIRTVMTSVGRTIIGTLLALVFASAIYFLLVVFAGRDWIEAFTSQYIPFVSTPLLLSALLGMAGSTVSIFFRLGDFEGPTRKSQQFLQMTGLMLPLIGAIFAFVLAAVIVSGIINLELGAGGPKLTGSQASPYVFIVIGFWQVLASASRAGCSRGSRP
jgi:hypothetical protein